MSDKHKDNTGESDELLAQSVERQNAIRYRKEQNFRNKIWYPTEVLPLWDALGLVAERHVNLGRFDDRRGEGAIDEWLAIHRNSVQSEAEAHEALTVEMAKRILRAGRVIRDNAEWFDSLKTMPMPEVRTAFDDKVRIGQVLILIACREGVSEQDIQTRLKLIVASNTMAKDAKEIARGIELLATKIIDHKHEQKADPTLATGSTSREPSDAVAGADPSVVMPKVSEMVPNGDAAGSKLTRPKDGISSTARAIGFLYDRGKSTGRIPTNVEVARAVGVSRSTIQRDQGFQSAKDALKESMRMALPKGTKNDGNLEAESE